MTVESELTGAALDAAVFERVFGEKIKCSQGIQCADIPPFSEDIASAWTVVEVVSMSWTFALEQEADCTWACVLGGERFIADTAPLAICRAALYFGKRPTY